MLVKTAETPLRTRLFRPVWCHNISISDPFRLTLREDGDRKGLSLSELSLVVLLGVGAGDSGRRRGGADAV